MADSIFGLWRKCRESPPTTKPGPIRSYYLREHLSRTTKDLLSLQLLICPRGPTNYSPFFPALREGPRIYSDTAEKSMSPSPLGLRINLATTLIGLSLQLLLLLRGIIVFSPLPHPVPSFSTFFRWECSANIFFVGSGCNESWTNKGGTNYTQWCFVWKF